MDEAGEEAIERLSRIAAETGITIAVAESLSSGALSSAIGRGEGAGEWFGGGVVAYQMSSKVRALGVSPDVDPCSPDCARQLADGVRDVIGADLSASITGVGGPDPQDGHPAGEVWIGVSSDAGTDAERHDFAGEPADVIAQSVQAALRLLIAHAERMPDAR